METQQETELGWDKRQRLIVFAGQDNNTKVEAILASYYFLKSKEIPVKIVFLPAPGDSSSAALSQDYAAKQKAIEEYADSKYTLLVNTINRSDFSEFYDACVEIDSSQLRQSKEILIVSSRASTGQIAKQIQRFYAMIWQAQPKLKLEHAPSSLKHYDKQLLESLRDNHNSLVIRHKSEIYKKSLDDIAKDPVQKLSFSHKLSEEHQQIAQEALQKCLAKLSELLNEASDPKIYKELVGLLPLALVSKYTKEVEPCQTHRYNRLTSDFIVQLPFADVTVESVRIVAAAPLNEIGVLTHALYELADTGIHDVEAAVDALPFTDKHNLYEELIKEHPREIMRHTYELEVILPIYDLIGLQQTLSKSNLVVQPLNPRLGYVVPESLSNLPSTESIEEIYDDVLALYSKLSLEYDSHTLEQLLLCGFKARARLVISSHDLIELTEQTEFERPWLKPVLAQLALKHPLAFSDYAS